MAVLGLAVLGLSRCMASTWAVDCANSASSTATFSRYSCTWNYSIDNFGDIFLNFFLENPNFNNLRWKMLKVVASSSIFLHVPNLMYKVLCLQSKIHMQTLQHRNLFFVQLRQNRSIDLCWNIKDTSSCVHGFGIKNQHVFDIRFSIFWD